MTEVFIIALINSMSSHIFLQWLRLSFGAYVLEINKHTRWKQLSVNVTDLKCNIGIKLIFDMVIFLTCM